MEMYLLSLHPANSLGYFTFHPLTDPIRTSFFLSWAHFLPLNLFCLKNAHKMAGVSFLFIFSALAGWGSWLTSKYSKILISARILSLCFSVCLRKIFQMDQLLHVLFLGLRSFSYIVHAILFSPPTLLHSSSHQDTHKTYFPKKLVSTD